MLCSYAVGARENKTTLTTTTYAIITGQLLICQLQRPLRRGVGAILGPRQRLRGPYTGYGSYRSLA